MIDGLEGEGEIMEIYVECLERKKKGFLAGNCGGGLGFGRGTESDTIIGIS